MNIGWVWMGVDSGGDEKYRLYASVGLFLSLFSFCLVVPSFQFRGRIVFCYCCRCIEMMYIQWLLLSLG
jgi:hypothetical protein